MSTSSGQTSNKDTAVGCVSIVVLAILIATVWAGCSACKAGDNGGGGGDSVVEWRETRSTRLRGSWRLWRGLGSEHVCLLSRGLLSEAYWFAEFCSDAPSGCSRLTPRQMSRGVYHTRPRGCSCKGHHRSALRLRAHPRKDKCQGFAHSAPKRVKSRSRF